MGAVVDHETGELSGDISAEAINAEWRAARDSLKATVGHLYNAGSMLLEKQEQLGPRGGFIKWVETNCEFPYNPAATRMMKTAVEVDRITNGEGFASERLTETEIVGLLRYIWGHVPHVANNSGENEWYTPRKYIESARKAMGSIDLDPASSAKANETVQAEAFYTPKENGLDQNWYGNVWLNPPYSKELVPLFAQAVLDKRNEYDAACVLVNNATETEWSQQLLDRCDAVCFIDGRIKYLDKSGAPAKTPLQGQMILYFGPDQDRFKQVFEIEDEHGEVLRR